MKNIIYYFSGTGNSYFIAREISLKLNDAGLISISKELKKMNQ
ncbi:MAG TPA: hypothetical protein PLD27_01425 [bacterium]|nr:hypothetical protein [bacterium]HPQ17802.1 hypothetical protein [bacterium]